MLLCLLSFTYKINNNGPKIDPWVHHMWYVYTLNHMIDILLNVFCFQDNFQKGENQLPIFASC